MLVSYFLGLVPGLCGRGQTAVAGTGFGDPKGPPSPTVSCLLPPPFKSQLCTQWLRGRFFVFQKARGAPERTAGREVHAGATSRQDEDLPSRLAGDCPALPGTRDREDALRAGSTEPGLPPGPAGREPEAQNVDVEKAQPPGTSGPEGLAHGDTKLLKDNLGAPVSRTTRPAASSRPPLLVIGIPELASPWCAGGDMGWKVPT